MAKNARVKLEIEFLKKEYFRLIFISSSFFLLEENYVNYAVHKKCVGNNVNTIET